MNKLLYEEGTDAIAHDRGEQGLLLLRDLQERKPNYPGLAGRLNAGYALQVSKSFAAGSYARARRFLHDMEVIAPDDSETKDARERFIIRAKQLAAAAPKEMGTSRTEALAERPRLAEARWGRQAVRRSVRRLADPQRRRLGSVALGGQERPLPRPLGAFSGRRARLPSAVLSDHGARRSRFGPRSPRRSNRRLG